MAFFADIKFEPSQNSKVELGSVIKIQLSASKILFTADHDCQYWSKISSVTVSNLSANFTLFSFVYC